MTTQFIIAQIVGFVGVVSFIVSFQIKSNRALFIIQSFGNALFGLQFLLLGAYTGCLSIIVLIIRNIFLLKLDKWKWVTSKAWITCLCLMGIVIMFYTWNGFSSILSCIALIGGNITMCSNNAQTIRLGNLVCISPAWLVYDIVVGAYAGILNEICVLSSIFISIYRYGWKAMGDPESGF